MNGDKNFSHRQNGKINQRQIAGFEFAQKTYRNNLRMPNHFHDYPYISFILRGGYEEKIRNRSNERFPQTVIFHPPQEGHAVNFFDAQTLIFQIKIETAFNQDDHLKSIFEDSFSVKNETLNLILTRIYSEHKRNDNFSNLAIHGLMLELLAEVGRYKSEKKNKDKNPKWLGKIKEILSDDFNSKRTLEEIAAQINVHPVYLSREFRRLTGCTIGEFTRRLRIEKACRKLAKSEKKLSEIAVELGFYDQSHFTNTFKRITGITPAEYRLTFQ